MGTNLGFYSKREWIESASSMVGSYCKGLITGSIKSRKFVDYLTEYQFLTNDPVQWNSIRFMFNLLKPSGNFTYD
jgi:hypothetical protein